MDHTIAGDIRDLAAISKDVDNVSVTVGDSQDFLAIAGQRHIHYKALKLNVCLISMNFYFEILLLSLLLSFVCFVVHST